MGNDDVATWSGGRSTSVDRADLHADGTVLSLHDGRCVRFTAAPDPAGSRRVCGVLRRVERVDVTIGSSITAVVTGVGHRRRCRLPVAIPTALSLALDGYPTSVTVLAAALRDDTADATMNGVAR